MREKIKKNVCRLVLIFNLQKEGMRDALLNLVPRLSLLLGVTAVHSSTLASTLGLGWFMCGRKPKQSICMRFLT